MKMAQDYIQQTLITAALYYKILKFLVKNNKSIVTNSSLLVNKISFIVCTVFMAFFIKIIQSLEQFKFSH